MVIDFSWQSNKSNKTWGTDLEESKVLKSTKMVGSVQIGIIEPTASGCMKT